MSIEAEKIEPVEAEAAEAAVETQVQPDSTDDKVENTLPPAQAEAGQPEKTETDLYLDVVEKYEQDPSYDMSEEEAEAFLSVTEQVNQGKIETPTRKEKGKEQPPEEKPEEEPEAEKEEDPKPEEEEDNGEYSVEDSKTLMEAMGKVGAKDLSELPGKIDGLIKKMTSSGGKQGSELAKLKRDQENFLLWAQDLAEGKNEAVEYLEKLTGKKPAFSHKPSQTEEEEPESVVEDEEIIDTKLAGVVNRLEDTIKKQAKVIETLQEKETKREEQHQHNSAVDYWVEDIEDLVADNSKELGLTVGEARALAKEYWAPDAHKKAVNPRFNKVHEVIKFANEGNYPSIKSAYIVMQHEKGIYANRLASERKKGQQEVQHTPTPNAAMSQKQSRMNEPIPEPHITEEKVDKMLSGDYNSIPDSWIGEDGILIKENIPERFHKKLGI